MKMDIIMEKNGITVGIRQEYNDIGRVYGCYFLYRYGTYNQFIKKLQRTHIPICGRKKLEEYVGKETKILSEIWRLTPPKKKQK